MNFKFKELCGVLLIQQSRNIADEAVQSRVCLFSSLGILLVRQYRVESGKLREAGTQGLQAVQLINTD
jgi:hypothetical protein